MKYDRLNKKKGKLRENQIKQRKSGKKECRGEVNLRIGETFGKEKNMKEEKKNKERRSYPDAHAGEKCKTQKRKGRGERQRGIQCLGKRRKKRTFYATKKNCRK